MHAVGGKPVFLALNKKKEAYSAMHPKSWTDFWRCIFLWQKKEISRKSIARSSRDLL